MTTSALDPETQELLQRRNALADPLSRLDRMLEIRAVEEALQDLFNGGFIRGSTHLSIGQEAVSVGLAAVLRPTDWVTCTYRGHGTALALGVSPTSVIGEITGRVIGCVGGLGGSMHLSAPEVGLMPTFAIVGAGYPVAAGAAMTAQFNGTDNIAVGICGDGATNIGAFFETLNLASIWKLPAVFIVENNLYGEYSRIELTTPVTDLAIRAEGFAMPSAIVDGQDIDAVMEALTDAVDRARAGGGPTLLEMKTYRYSGHSRADKATYRPAGELDEWLQRDPVELYAAKLGISPESLQERRGLVAAEVKSAVDEALASPEPPISDLFRFI
jgi:TPP-dependent pyruvate/acetoin dehydrogenase alpha subunit